MEQRKVKEIYNEMSKEGRDFIKHVLEWEIANPRTPDTRATDDFYNKVRGYFQ